MSLPHVSVIIPAYNAAGTIGPCVESALAAEYEGEREVVVVDDGSTDETVSIVESRGGRVIRMASNGGPALARNAGAKAAKGEILIFIDSDTQMRPDSIAQAVKALDEDGVGAVTGMYEAEPLNSGFFPAYYSYLKYHAFVSQPVRRINAFGAQCGAISRRLFEEVGGYRPFAWGVDIENDEFGHRVNQRAAIALSREFRVGHNFPDFRKLMYVFTRRVFWWIRFAHQTKRSETVLMTRGIGWATAALPAAGVMLVLGLIAPVGSVSTLLLFLSAVGAGWFCQAYARFWRFCAGRRGIGFGVAAALASGFFSFVILASAACGYLSVAWSALQRRDMPLVQASLGKA